jgi:hypothetical protein
VSAKRRAGRPAWDAVYDAVDRRSGGWCEVVLRGLRCRRRAEDHHHTRKPRARYHRPELVIHLCRRHHDQAEAAYARGRLLIEPGGDGRLVCRVVVAADKFAARALARTRIKGHERFRWA